MRAREKLDEAEYFYRKLVEDCEERDLVVIRYHLSAFLAAVRSIPDYALEDANVAFRLGIPIESRSIRLDFKKRMSNACEEARRFYDIWTRYETWLNKAPLMNLRHINIHRRGANLAAFMIAPGHREDIRDMAKIKTIYVVEGCNDKELPEACLVILNRANKFVQSIELVCCTGKPEAPTYQYWYS
jgi:hypothetical protein